MDKKRLEYIITGLLILVFVFSLAGSMRKVRTRPQGKRAASALPGLTEPREPESIFGIRKEKVKKEFMGKGAGWGRDPFSLEEASGGKEGTVSLKLMGIITRAHAKPKAIINNEILSEGGRIGKYAVLSITKDRVTVSDGQETIELELQL